MPSSPRSWNWWITPARTSTADMSTRSKSRRAPGVICVSLSSEHDSRPLLDEAGNTSLTRPVLRWMAAAVPQIEGVTQDRLLRLVNHAASNSTSRSRTPSRMRSLRASRPYAPSDHGDQGRVDLRRATLPRRLSEDRHRAGPNEHDTMPEAPRTEGTLPPRSGSPGVVPSTVSTSFVSVATSTSISGSASGSPSSDRIAFSPVVVSSRASLFPPSRPYRRSRRSSTRHRPR